ncbi:MAG: hypothetical protein ABI700_08885 [Chloroflexota bacterium]
MSDLPPFNDDDDFPFEQDADEKPKRHQVLDDGELPFEMDVEKPKKRPPSPWWRKTYIPIPLLAAICVLLICSAVLLLGTSFTNGSLLCNLTNLCVHDSSTPYPTAEPTLFNDPLPPYDQGRVIHYSVADAQGNTTKFDATMTPIGYTMPRCDPNADYADHLMFTMGEDDNAEIFLIAEDGKNICRLTENHIEEKLSDWSADRQHILFSSDRSDRQGEDIYGMNFDGTNIVNLTQDQSTDFGGVWSPDGTRIAFTSYRGSGGQIYMMNADGTDQQNITPDALNASSPSWSPDGTQIAYMAGSDGDANKFEIYLLDVSTKVSQRFTVDSASEYSPMWSPSGTQLLLYADALSALGQYQGTDIFRLTLSNPRTPRRLTTRTDAVWPTWSPDGQQIAYIAANTLHILNLNTSKDRALPTGYGVRWRPIWR